MTDKAEKIQALEEDQRDIDRKIKRLNMVLACKGYPDKADMAARSFLYKELEKVEKALDKLRRTA